MKKENQVCLQKPKMYYAFPLKRFYTFEMFVKWIEEMEVFYCVAIAYESQKMGKEPFKVRAYGKWIKPELRKMYKYMKEKLSSPNKPIGGER